MSRLATRLRRIGFTYRYGLPVRFQLLSTPPLNDAVTFSYGDVARPGADFHRADTTPLRAHSFQRKLESSLTFHPVVERATEKAVPQLSLG